MALTLCKGVSVPKNKFGAQRTWCDGDPIWGQEPRWDGWLSLVSAATWKIYSHHSLPAALLGWSKKDLLVARRRHGGKYAQLQVPSPARHRGFSAAGSTEFVELMLITRAGSTLFEPFDKRSVELRISYLEGMIMQKQCTNPAVTVKGNPGWEAQIIHI
jgi:hypothetical protein